MEEEEDVSSPFWLQSTRQTGHRRRRSPSSFLFNSGALLVFLLAVAVAFIFIVIPSIQSFTSQIFKPHAVKRSWDSLNLVLVLFAIICGFLSRNHNNNESIAATPTTTSAAASASYEDEEYKFDNRSESFQKSNPETPRRFWYDHAYSNNNNNNNNNNNGGLSRLRSFSSHPDLRQEEALWANVEDQWRFYDDTHLYHHRFSSFDYKQQHQWRPQPQPQPKLEVLEEEKEKKENEEVDAVKNVDADNATSSTVEESRKEIIYTPPQPPPASPSPEPAESPPSPSPPPPLPPPQPKVVRRRVKRTHQGNGGNYRNNDLEVKPPPPQRQPLPPPALPEPEVEESGGKSEKKRGGASATKEFLTSLRRKKKKKQRQKSVENLDSFFNYESSYPLPPSLIPPPSPPPPPPPTPPPPFFQNIFSSRKRKAKKTHSVIPSPPPPPPPPPPPTRTQKLSTSRTRNVQSTSQEPSLPAKVKSYSNVEQNVNSGNESPLNAIPPPPPLPPFKMPAWKFEVHGDFVRLKSNDIGADDVEESSCPSDGGDSPVVTPLSCPSPDVNAKADNFIARFRAGLRLEKMNSVKEKEGRRRSNLGPEPSPAKEGESPS